MSIKTRRRHSSHAAARRTHPAQATAPQVVEKASTRALPEWTEDGLEVDLADALEAWTRRMRDDRPHLSTVAELLDTNDASMSAAYGPARSAFLAGLTFSARADTRRIEQNQFGPDEYETFGFLQIRSAGRVIASIDFREDGPDVYGRILAAGPTL